MDTPQRLTKLKACLTLLKIRSRSLQCCVDIINPIWQDLNLKYTDQEKQKFLSEFLKKEELDNLSEEIRNSSSEIKKFLWTEAKEDYEIIDAMIYGNTVQQVVDIIYKLSVVLEFEQLETINKAINKVERKIQKLEGKNDSFQ